MERYKPQKHHRRSVRLKGYDYAQAGLYFVTICVQNRECIFGEIVNGVMGLNDAGIIVQNCWLEIPKHFPNIELHNFVIMPNHIHGIIEIVGANKYSPEISNTDIDTNSYSPEISNIYLEVNNYREDNDDNRAKDDNVGNGDIRAKDFSPLRRSPSKTIGSMVRGFKIGVTKWFRQNTDVHNIWQRNYYEHIIRNEQSYETISNYIIKNPVKWAEDRFYI